MRAAAALIVAVVLVVALPAASPARPSPVKVKVHRHAKKTRALVSRMRSGRLVGVSGSSRAGAPAAFGTQRPFGSGAPVASAPGGGGTAAPGPVASPAPTPTGPTLPTIPTNPRALQVQAYEFGLTLSKGTVLSGGVRVEFNSSRAEDPHNLYLARADGTGAVYHFDEQASGAVSSKSLTLSTGRWTLFCSLPGHEAAGMKATLTVSAE
jgi:Copper binding proteins, plastocyanin/azurin family